MPLYCGGLDSIPELSKSWYATPAHRYRNCQCALIAMAIEYPPNAGTHQAAQPLSAPRPQYYAASNNSKPRQSVPVHHRKWPRCPYRGIRDDVDISKDYVDIDAEPFSNLRHQRFRNFLGHILHPDQSLTFRQSHQKGVMVLFSYLAITHIKSAISAKTLGHSIRITTLPFRLRCR